jgi:hypothetical protein
MSRNVAERILGLTLAMKTLNEVLAECEAHGRVSPQPQKWNELWELLPDRRRQGAGWEPPLPLILAAWHDSSDAEKRERLRLHLRWARSTALWIK